MRVSDDDDDDDCFTVKAKVSSKDNFDKQSGTVTLRIRLRDEQFASITITKGDDLLDSCSKFGAEHGLDYSSVNHLFEQLKERCRLISQFRDVKSTTGQLKDHTDTNANVHANVHVNADANRNKSNQDKASLNTVGTSETIKNRSYQSLSSKITGVDIPKITAISYPRKAGSFTSTATSTAPTSSSSSPEKNIPSVSSKSSSPVKRSESGTFRHSDQSILLPDDSDTLRCHSSQECSIEGSSGDIFKNIPKKILENVPCEIEDNDEKLQEDAFNIAKKNLQEWNTTERSSSSSPITSIMSHFLTTNREKEKENLEKKLNLEIPSTLSSPSKINILLSNNLKIASNIFNEDDQDIISRFSSTQNSINKTQKSSTLRSNSPSLIQQKKSSERMHGHGQKFENKKAYLRLQFEKDRIETIQSTTFRY
jgi:hypothetical protein